MAHNIIAPNHTKQMDIMYEYVNKYVDNGSIKTVLTESAENDDNNLMKNLAWKVSKKL